MSKLIYCVKLKKEAEGFEKAPFPGAVGEKIVQSISKEAWHLWINQQTMLINEYRLSLLDPNARTFLLKEMENFLFADSSSPPPQYVAEKK